MNFLLCVLSFSLLDSLLHYTRVGATDTAMQAYSTLVGNGVLLRPQVLSRLLGLMREQTQPMLSAFVPLPQLARGILQEIRDQGPCNLEDYHTVLRILNTAQQPVQ